jgi:hypothetical protein
LLFSGFILKAVSLLTKQVSTYIFAETLSDLRKARLRKQLFLQVEGPLWLSSVPSVKKKKKKKKRTDWFNASQTKGCTEERGRLKKRMRGKGEGEEVEVNTRADIRSEHILGLWAVS